MRGNPDLEDTIRRLQAYEKAGADVLFAPALPDLAAVRRVCSAVSKPVNFMVGIRGKSFTMAELVEAGVKRISFASSLYRAAMTGLIEAASEAKQRGTFNYLEKTIADSRAEQVPSGIRLITFESVQQPCRSSGSAPAHWYSIAVRFRTLVIPTWSSRLQPDCVPMQHVVVLAGNRQRSAKPFRRV